MALNLAKAVIGYLKERPEEKFTARQIAEYVKLVKQFYQTGEARPADWDVPETGD